MNRKKLEQFIEGLEEDRARLLDEAGMLLKAEWSYFSSPQHIDYQIKEFKNLQTQAIKNDKMIELVKILLEADNDEM